MQTPAIAEPLSDVFLSKLGKTALIVLGAPCSGKTDLRKRFSDDKISHFESSGQIREFANSHSRKDLLEKMNSGDLVDLKDMEDICNLAAQKFQYAGSLGLFVGFGRRRQELDFLLCRLRNMCRGLKVKVVCLEVSEETAFTRCTAITEERNDCDKILKRHREWRKEKTSIISYLEQRGIPFRILDTTSLSELQVYNETLALLDAFE